MKSSKVLLLVLCSIQSVTSFANHNSPLMNAQYGGTGCSAGSADFHQTSSGVSLELSEFQIYLDPREAGLERKSCSISIPVKVKKGTKVGIRLPKLAGSLELPRGAMAQVKITGFVSGSMETVSTEDTIYGSETISLRKLNLDQDILFTECGEDAVLNLKTAIYLRKANGSDSAMAELRAITLGELVIKKCN